MKKGSKRAGHEEARERVMNKLFVRLDSLNETNCRGFFSIVRAFFSGLFNLKYHFTFEELSDEVKKRHLSSPLKDKTRNFLSRLVDEEYAEGGGSEKSIKKLSEEFKEIMVELIAFYNARKHTLGEDSLEREASSISGKMLKLSKMRLEKSRIFSFRKMVKSDQENIRNLREDINRISYFHDRREYGEVRRGYGRLIADYKRLPESSKVVVYHDIMELHKKVSGAHNKKENLKTVVAEINLLLDGINRKQLRRHYLSLMNIYNTLPNYEKQELYPKLMDLRKKITYLSKIV